MLCEWQYSSAPIICWKNLLASSSGILPRRTMYSNSSPDRYSITITISDGASMTSYLRVSSVVSHRYWGRDKWPYSLMIWGCRSRERYWIWSRDKQAESVVWNVVNPERYWPLYEPVSDGLERERVRDESIDYREQLTLFDISAVEILRLEMNFIATFSPVSLCLASLTLPKEPCPNVAWTS